MKHDCDIVRDLMPMCIDGTASDKSRQMVDEHVQECLPCDAIYREMKSDAGLEIPVQPRNAEFAYTVKRLNKYRKQRTLMTALVGMLTAVVLLVAAYGVYWQFFEPVPVLLEELTVYATQEGEACILLENAPENVQLQILIAENEYAPDKYVAHLSLYSTRHHRAGKDGSCCFEIGTISDKGIAIRLEDRTVEVTQVAYKVDWGGSMNESYKNFLQQEVEENDVRQAEHILMIDEPPVAFVTPQP